MKDTSINKGFLFSELKKALPCRIGIEFELGGNFPKSFKTKYGDKKYTDVYKVLEVNCDECYDNDTDNIREVRVSIINFKQLSGLYKFMDDLNEFCKLHEGGGIHVHLDLTEFDLESDRYRKKQKEIQGYLQNRLDLLQSKLPKYTGNYNEKRVKINTKRSWINLSRLNTMEVRILPLTFKYDELMSWIKVLVNLRQNMIHQCRLIPLKKYLERKSNKKNVISVEDVEEVIRTINNRIDSGDGLIDYATNNGTYQIYTRYDNSTGLRDYYTFPV